ncbi:MAG: VWA domain-containing protein [Ruminococcus sp.]|jgi:hypothetical protein|nr:VWA domain-containing protein [Ruminococcus sp.]
MPKKSNSNSPFDKLNPEIEKKVIKRTAEQNAADMDLLSDIDFSGTTPEISKMPEKVSRSHAHLPPPDKDGIIEISFDDPVENTVKTISGTAKNSRGDVISAGEMPPLRVNTPTDLNRQPKMHKITPMDHDLSYTEDDRRRMFKDLETDTPANSRHTKRILPSELEALKAEQEENAVREARYNKKVQKKKNARSYAEHTRMKYSTEEIRKHVRSTVIGIVVILLCVYFAAYFYVRESDKTLRQEITNLLSRDTVTAILDIQTFDTSLSEADKAAFGLSRTLIDSDFDRLTDSYEIDHGLSPKKPDTDGDGVPDGIEVAAGIDPLNPLTDGTADGERHFEYIQTVSDVTLRIQGTWQIYNAALNIFPRQYLNYPGVKTEAFEVTLPENTTATLEFKNAARSDGIFKISPGDGEYETLITSNDGGGVISAAVGSGVYFTADTGIMTSGNIGDATLNIMFLIDNSGSMYSKELVTDSEENDLDFKRIDFAQSLISEMGEKANFGVAKFTLQYMPICEISSDDTKAQAALETIRTSAENWNGTEISQSIINAVSEFAALSSDRNYIVVITDGLPTDINREKEEQAVKLCIDNNISVITVGLGRTIDPNFLSEIASETGGVYYQAVNNTSFEAISSKLTDLLAGEEAIEIPSESSAPGKINGAVTDTSIIPIADSGFTFKEDALILGAVPTSEAPDGLALGLALMSKLYYIDSLNVSEPSFTGNDLKTVEGYDLSDSEFFKSGKTRLGEYILPSALTYETYMNIKNKWDFDNITDRVLPLSPNALNIINQPPFTKIVRNAENLPTKNIPKFIRDITFSELTEFEFYETGAIDESLLTGEEASVFKAVDYYNRLTARPGVRFLSLGVNGAECYDTLFKTLTLGEPAVVVSGGQIYIASKLSRYTDNPDKFVLECYSPTGEKNQEPTYIYLSETKIESPGVQSDRQFSSTLHSVMVDTYIIDVRS